MHCFLLLPAEEAYQIRGFRGYLHAAKEIVKDGENGFVCQLDEQEIASAALELIKDGALRTEMSLRARNFVFENYDWDKVTLECERFYYDLIKNRQR